MCQYTSIILAVASWYLDILGYVDAAFSNSTTFLSFVLDISMIIFVMISRASCIIEYGERSICPGKLVFILSPPIVIICFYGPGTIRG